MSQMDRQGMSLAFGAGSRRIALDMALRCSSEPRVELHDDGDERRIYRPKKASRWRHRSTAIDLVEDAVAEHAMMHQVVCNGDIEGLIEIGEPFRMLQQNRSGQDSKQQKSEYESGAPNRKCTVHGPIFMRPIEEMRRAGLSFAWTHAETDDVRLASQR